MTKRQLEAVAWLESVGKATETLVRKNGFAVRTFDALADQGFVHREHVSRPGGSFTVYRPTPARRQRALRP